MTIPVCVVDASEEFGIVIRHTLEETGRYQVILAGSGAEAIEISQATEIRLAIVDFDLPDIPGPDCIRRLQELNPDLAVIAIPYSNDPNDPELRELDVKGVLTKPFYLPKLAQIVARALDQPVEEAAVHPVKRPKPARQTLTPPPWLMDSDQAARYLTDLSRESSAVAALLIRDRKLWAYAGELDRDRAPDLIEIISSSWPREGTRGAVAKFIRIPDIPDDLMLYASAVADDIILSLVFHAETPFGTIRRQAQRLVTTLSEIDPSIQITREEIPPLAQEETPQVDTRIQLDAPTAPDREGLPDTPDLPFLTDLELPSPDPEPGPMPTDTGSISDPSSSLSLPDDWVPSRPRSVSDLPFLDPSGTPAKEVDTLPLSDIPLPEAKYHLPFTAILLPRFPEHQLTGPLAGHLEDWVERLCLAWDWRADEILIKPDYLSLTVTLSPEIAPSRAVHQLRHDLSNRILATFPELDTDLPSRRFWARSYLLKTGSPPTQERVQAFILGTRQAQGLED